MSNTFNVNIDQIIRIDVNSDSLYTINLKAEHTGNVIIILDGNGSLDLNVYVGANSYWHYLLVNNSNESLNIEENIYVKDYGNVVCSYSLLNNGNHAHHTYFQMIGSHSEVVMNAAVMCSHKLKWLTKANHLNTYSKAILNSSAILLEEGYLELEVIGYIEKGMRKSETHQFTKVLNLGKTMKGIVYPKLLIDENDVKASHAATIGKPNPEEIYYMRSRGISENEVLKLIIRGYLMPITDDIEDEGIKNSIKDEIEMKVMNLWKV